MSWMCSLLLNRTGGDAVTRKKACLKSWDLKKRLLGEAREALVGVIQV